MTLAKLEEDEPVEIEELIFDRKTTSIPEKTHSLISPRGDEKSNHVENQNKRAICVLNVTNKH